MSAQTGQYHFAIKNHICEDDLKKISRSIVSERTSYKKHAHQHLSFTKYNSIHSCSEEKKTRMCNTIIIGVGIVSV